MKPEDFNNTILVAKSVKDNISKFFTVIGYKYQYNRYYNIGSRILQAFNIKTNSYYINKIAEDIENLDQYIAKETNSINKDSIITLKANLFEMLEKYKSEDLRDYYIERLKDQSNTSNAKQIDETIQKLSQNNKPEAEVEALTMLIKNIVEEYDKNHFAVDKEFVTANLRATLIDFNEYRSKGIFDKFKKIKAVEYISNKFTEFSSFLNSKTWFKKTKNFLSTIYNVITSSVFINSLWIISSVITFGLAVAASGGLVLPLIGLIGTIATIGTSIATNVNSMRSYRKLVEENEYLTALKDLRKGTNKIIDSFDIKELKKDKIINFHNNLSSPKKPTLLKAFAKVERDNAASTLLFIFQLISSFSIPSLIFGFINSIATHTLSTLARKDRDERKYLISQEIHYKRQEKDAPTYSDLKDLKQQYIIEKKRFDELQKLVKISNENNLSKEEIIKNVTDIYTERPIIEEKKFLGKTKENFTNAFNKFKNLGKDIGFVLNPFNNEGKLPDITRKNLYGNEKELAVHLSKKKFTEQPPLPKAKPNTVSIIAENIRNNFIVISTIGTLNYVFDSAMPLISSTAVGASIVGAAVSQAATSFCRFQEKVKNASNFDNDKNNHKKTAGIKIRQEKKLSKEINKVNIPEELNLSEIHIDNSLENKLPVKDEGKTNIRNL